MIVIWAQSPIPVLEVDYVFICIIFLNSPTYSWAVLYVESVIRYHPFIQKYSCRHRILICLPRIHPRCAFHIEIDPCLTLLGEVG